MTLRSLDGSGYTKERLFTPEGGFVAEVSIPPFVSKPEVLIWGARVFLHIDSYELVEFEPMPGIEAAEGCYIEAFAYHIPPEAHHSTLPGGLDKKPPVIGDRVLVSDDSAADVGTGRLSPNHYELRRRHTDEGDEYNQ